MQAPDCPEWGGVELLGVRLPVAIVVIAATCTRASHCVLLFGLPCRVCEVTPVGPASAMMQSPEGLFAGLTRCPIGPPAHPERTICAESDPQLTLTPAGRRAVCHFAGEHVAGQPSTGP